MENNKEKVPKNPVDILRGLKLKKKFDNSTTVLTDVGTGTRVTAKKILEQPGHYIKRFNFAWAFEISKNNLEIIMKAELRDLILKQD